jgi:hypothetical protein
MLNKLPEDRGFGKLFWIIAGSVLTALVGIPLVYLVDAFTPKPDFEIRFPSLNHAGVDLFLKNSSKVADAKSAIVTFHLVYDEMPKYDKYNQLLVGDPNCKKYSSNDVAYNQEEISFECPLINRGEKLHFESLIGHPPLKIRVSIVYSGGSFKKSFIGHVMTLEEAAEKKDQATLPEAYRKSDVTVYTEEVEAGNHHNNSMIIRPVAANSFVELSCTHTNGEAFVEYLDFGKNSDGHTLVIRGLRVCGDLIERYDDGETGPLYKGAGANTTDELRRCPILNSAITAPVQQHVRITDDSVEFWSTLNGKESINILDLHTGLLKGADGSTASCITIKS